nr:Ig-like domain-containing protein [Lachnospiraceae bacterium]
AEPGKQVMGVNLASPDTKTKDLNYRLGMDVPKPVTVTVTPADAANPDFELSNVNESVITAEKAEEGSDLNITPVGVGVSKITVTTEDGNFSDTMTVTVRHTTPAAKEQGDYIGGLTPEATYSVGIYNGNMSPFTADENGQIPILPEWRSKTIGIIRTDAVFTRLNSDTQSLKINRKAIAYDPESGVSVAFDDSEDEVFIYTGRKIKPKVIVYNEARTFAEKTDYVVTYKNNLKVGTARVIVKAAKKSKTLSKKFKQTFTFEIVPHDISEGVEAPAVYIESGKKAKPFLLFGKKKLTAGKDFDYDKSRVFTENGSITVTGIINFTGELPVDVVIRTQKPRKFKAKIFKDEDYEPLTYDGSEQYPDITVYDPKEGMEDGLPVKVLSEGTDYIIGWPMNCTDAGKHKYTIYGIGEEYSGTITKSYSIRGVKLWESKEDIDWPTYMEKDEETGKYEYEELPYRPGGVTIDDDDSLFGLEKGVDYTISYSNNKKPGIAKYSIKFKKNYGRTKSISRKFRIVKASIAADAEASLILSSQYFDGSDGTYAATPYVVCDDERGSLLKKGKDYIMHYYLDEKHSPDREITKERPVTAGDFGDKAFITIYATAVGKGKYDPETSIANSYRLYRTPPAEPAIDLARDVKVVCRPVDYKGVRIEPSPELIDSVEICRDGVWTFLTGDELEDFKTAVTVDLACANNLNAGTASLIITGRNNAGSETPFFYGSKKVSFKIKKSVG